MTFVKVTFKLRHCRQREQNGQWFSVGKTMAGTNKMCDWRAKQDTEGGASEISMC